MDLEPSTLINHSRERQFEYSNSLTRPELLPVAVFYGKTQLENEQTPPDRRPGGPQLPLPPHTAVSVAVLTTLYDRVAVMLAAGAVAAAAAAIQHPTYTAMWGESITPFAQRVVLAQHASCLNAPTAVK